MIKRVDYGIEECIKLSGHAPREIRCGVETYMEIKQNIGCICHDIRLFKYKGIKITKDLNLSDDTIQIIIENDIRRKDNDMIDRFLRYINV